jgi:tripartite-type tricarboxylate transporter receptor subunit TctC
MMRATRSKIATIKMGLIFLNVSIGQTGVKIFLQGGRFMNQKRILSIGVVVLTLLSIPVWGLTAEKKFPTKPIQVIIPFQPGDTDNLLRPFIEKMPEFLGQPVTLVYKPGAGGSVGAGIVTTSAPDGHILLGSSQSSVVLVPLTQEKIPYTWESFAPVSCLVEGALVFVVQTNAPWKDVNDLVADAKKRPNQISISPGSGSLGILHIAAEAFAKEAGIKLNFIPSQSSGAAVTAVLGGHVNIASTGIGPVLPHVKAGGLRILAAFNKNRTKPLPEAATFAEMGYPVVLPVNYGILAPRETPKEAIEILTAAVKKIRDKYGSEISDRLVKLGAQDGFMGPEEYKEFLRGQNIYFNKLLKGMK